MTGGGKEWQRGTLCFCPALPKPGTELWVAQLNRGFWDFGTAMSSASPYTLPLQCLRGGRIRLVLAATQG